LQAAVKLPMQDAMALMNGIDVLICIIGVVDIYD